MKARNDFNSALRSLRAAKGGPDSLAMGVYERSAARFVHFAAMRDRRRLRRLQTASSPLAGERRGIRGMARREVHLRAVARRRPTHAAARRSLAGKRAARACRPARPERSLSQILKARVMSASELCPRMARQRSARRRAVGTLLRARFFAHHAIA
jgi:hypothetical protein